MRSNQRQYPLVVKAYSGTANAVEFIVSRLLSTV